MGAPLHVDAGSRPFCRAAFDSPPRRVLRPSSSVSRQGPQLARARRGADCDQRAPWWVPSRQAGHRDHRRRSARGGRGTRPTVHVHRDTPTRTRSTDRSGLPETVRDRSAHGPSRAGLAERAGRNHHRRSGRNVRSRRTRSALEVARNRGSRGRSPALPGSSQTQRRSNMTGGTDDSRGRSCALRPIQPEVRRIIRRSSVHQASPPGPLRWFGTRSRDAPRSESCRGDLGALAGRAQGLSHTPRRTARAWTLRPVHLSGRVGARAQHPAARRSLRLARS